MVLADFGSIALCILPLQDRSFSSCPFADSYQTPQHFELTLLSDGTLFKTLKHLGSKAIRSESGSFVDCFEPDLATIPES